MVYYIFGSNDLILIKSVKDALYSSINIDDAYERFNAINLNKKYMNTYLICDFEINKPKALRPDKFVYGDDRIPFLIIGEYHEREDAATPLNTVRSDTLIIHARGFRHQFNNNKVAVMQFENNLKNNVDCQFYIKYKYKNDKNLDCINTAFIASTEEIVSKMDKSYGIRKVYLDDLCIENADSKTIVNTDKDGNFVSMRTINAEVEV